MACDVELGLERIKKWALKIACAVSLLMVDSKLAELYMNVEVRQNLVGKLSFKTSLHRHVS